MKSWSTTIGLICVFAIATNATAQFPTASDEHKVLKHEEGKWNAEVTMFMGPAGPIDPPQKSKGVESNRMIGSLP